MDERPGLNIMMLNMLGRKLEEDPDKHGHVTLMLDAMSNTILGLNGCQDMWT